MNYLITNSIPNSRCGAFSAIFCALHGGAFVAFCGTIPPISRGGVWGGGSGFTLTGALPMVKFLRNTVGNKINVEHRRILNVYIN